MIPSAIEIRELKAESGEAYFGTTIYRVEDRPGLWRRISRTASGLKSSRPGAVVCHRDDTLIELAPWDGLNDQLSKAGYVMPCIPPHDLPDDQEKAPADPALFPAAERW